MKSIHLPSLTWIIPALLIAVSAHAEKGLVVQGYYGTYETEQKPIGKPALSLVGPKTERWNAPQQTARQYRIGVLFPHIKDPYFIAVNYGIISEAKKLNLGVKLLEAGGYGKAGKQMKQFQQLVKEKVDGIILAAIKYRAMDKYIAQSNNIPVIAVINDIHAPTIKAKALVSFFDMGYAAGRFVIRDAQCNIKIAFFPGPKGSGWALDTFLGFQTAIKINPFHPGRCPIHLLRPKYGDTGDKMQASLITRLLKNERDIDYIVGNAVAANVAVDILKKYRQQHPKTKIVATYIIPAVYEKIAQGAIAAAPADLTVDQGRMAVDMMVKILNGKQPGKDFPFRAGPIIPTISPENIHKFKYEKLFGPKSFEPIFTLAPDVSDPPH